MAGKAIDQYKKLHSQRDYGTTSSGFFPLISLLLLDLKPRNILDYGCGQSTLYKKFNQHGFVNYDRYDPAIEEISDVPNKNYDLIINTDVMEHIPKHQIGSVLSHMSQLTHSVFFNIAMYPAKTILPSGENAHCTLETAEWWQEKIAQYFCNANIIYNRAGRECGIITWKENLPGIYKEIYSYMVENKQLKKALDKKRPFYKRLPEKWTRSIKKRL